MPELSKNPDDYETPAGYAHAQALNAKYDPHSKFAIAGGDDYDLFEVEYAIEPSPGDCARGHDNELAGVIEELPIYAAGARLITRQIRYGPWRYVTPEELENA